MANITKIVVNGLAHYNMGEATEADAEGYREWLAAELESAFPGADIEVNEEDAARSVVVRADDYDDGSLTEEVECFCADAWERCPWSWVK